MVAVRVDDGIRVLVGTRVLVAVRVIDGTRVFVAVRVADTIRVLVAITTAVWVTDPIGAVGWAVWVATTVRVAGGVLVGIAVCDGEIGCVGTAVGWVPSGTFAAIQLRMFCTFE